MSRPTVAVVGFPNVGKSTLVNRLAGGREAVTHAEPGVTRDRKRVPCEWNGVAFELLDTGGIDLADETELAADVQRQARIGIAEADVVLLVVDGRAGLRAGDAELAKTLRGADVPVLVAVNKADRPGTSTSPLNSTSSASASRSRSRPRTGSAAATCSTAWSSCSASGRRAAVEGEPVHVAIVGRPNAGKSSLVNALLGSERVIVSERAGTTRDTIDTELEVEGRPLLLVDTAGLRRRSKVAGTVDYYAQLRSELAVERADVAIVVCDATDGVTAEDLRIAELAMRAGCATLLALNKWDIGATDVDDARARVERKLRLRPEVVTCSALRGRNVAKLLPKALELADRAATRLPTPELNRFVADVVATTPPPSRRGRRLRLYYAAQIGVRPPRFAIQVNDRRLIVRDWAYHLENRMREAYGLEGIPLVIDFVPHSGRRGRA